MTGKPGLLSPYFNPPSPCGEGRGVESEMGSINQFQSTLPVWGGTFCLL